MPDSVQGNTRAYITYIKSLSLHLIMDGRRRGNRERRAREFLSKMDAKKYPLEAEMLRGHLNLVTHAKNLTVRAFAPLDSAPFTEACKASAGSGALFPPSVQKAILQARIDCWIDKLVATPSLDAYKDLAKLS